MTSLNDPAAYTLVAAGVTAALAYVSNRFSSRRASVADTLAAALRDAQRSRFLLDLENPDHLRVTAEPVAVWMAAASATWDTKKETLNTEERHPGTADYLKKFEEVLSWRVEEREARVRFAIVARSRDVRKFAAYHRSLYRAAVKSGQKHDAPVPAEYDNAVTELIHTVVSVRVPSILRPINHVARTVPGVNRLLIAEDDIRMLVADYTKSPPVQTTISHRV